MQSNPCEPDIEKRIESRREAFTALFQFRWMQNLVPGFPADLPGRFFPKSFSLEGYSLPQRLSTEEFNAVSVFANTSKGTASSARQRISRESD
jgi:hypothetical protein